MYFNMNYLVGDLRKYRVNFTGYPHTDFTKCDAMRFAICDVSLSMFRSGIALLVTSPTVFFYITTSSLRTVLAWASSRVLVGS